MLKHLERWSMGRLTKYEREQVELYFRRGLSGRAIAKMIGRHHSVIGRELTRNRSSLFSYEASRANYFSTRRAKKTNKRKIEKCEKLYEYVTKKLDLN